MPAKEKWFLLIDALCSSQQQWSCQDVASILWDFYPALECHDTQNVLHEYNHPIKPLRRMCMDGLTKPLFLGRRRLERLTSNHMGKVCLETQAVHRSISPRPHGGPYSHPTTLRMVSSQTVHTYKPWLFDWMVLLLI